MKTNYQKSRMSRPVVVLTVGLLAILVVVALPAGAAQAPSSGAAHGTLREQDEALERLLAAPAALSPSSQRNTIWEQDEALERLLAAGPVAPLARTAATRGDSVREQDELLERLQAEHSFALVARDATSAACDGACFQVLFQQMWELAEQVRRQ